MVDFNLLYLVSVWFGFGLVSVWFRFRFGLEFNSDLFFFVSSSDFGVIFQCFGFEVVFGMIRIFLLVS